MNKGSLGRKSLILNSIVHTIFWISYTLFLYLILIDRLPPNRPHPNLLQHIILFVLPQIALVYLNMEVLVPRFFITKRYLTYFLSMILLLILAFFLMEEIASGLLGDFEFFKGKFNPDNHMKRPRFGAPKRFPREFSPARGLAGLNFILTVAIVSLSTAIKTSQAILSGEKESAQLKSENLDAELKFLRSQINPHFLFNALNNIYNLSLKKSESTPEFIVKLSEILRYIIYDCNEQKVPLLKEIDYIKNYIDLQKLRDPEITKVTFNVSGNVGIFRIEPMLLIPFVENSFKHSRIEDVEEGWIEISVAVIDRGLNFSITNSLPEEAFVKDQTHGVGLENVKRRLSLLYPELHELIIAQDDNSFRVNLNILL